MVNVDNRGTGGPRGSNNSLYFIVGALVIAVLIIGWFMYGGDADVADDVNVTTESTPAAPAGDTNVTVEPTTPPPAAGDTNVTVEPTTPPPAAGDTNVTVEPTTPAAEPATPAPAEPATPPAGGAAPAPR